MLFHFHFEVYAMNMRPCSNGGMALCRKGGDYCFAWNANRRLYEFNASGGGICQHP
jgi:hypothetical protein